mgnify:FL=1
MTPTEFELLLHHYSETNAIVGRIAIRQKCSPQHVLHDFTRRVHERLQTMAGYSTDEAHT